LWTGIAKHLITWLAESNIFPDCYLFPGKLISQDRFFRIAEA
jgi:hypothetical protein